MKLLRVVLSVLCINSYVKAITNVEHAFVCENEKITLECKKGKVINVLDGNYGRTSASSCAQTDSQSLSCYQENTVSTVADLCEGKTECTFGASNHRFGDPCPGTVKYLFVLYHCVDPQEYKHALACEFSPIVLECPRGKVIQVFAAEYGRRSRLTCPDGPMYTTNCRSETALNVMSELCSHKQTCVVMANNNLFGDPCEKTPKYLSVKYKCVVGPDDCCARPASNYASHCMDGSIILPSFLCDGKEDCPNGDDEHMCLYNSKHVCQHAEILKIECGKNETIKIINANYGRTTNEICPTGYEGKDINCKAANSKRVLQLNCDGKQKCEVEATDRIFGDPCVGIHKYLDVQYNCEAGGSHNILPRSVN